MPRSLTSISALGKAMLALWASLLLASAAQAAPHTLGPALTSQSLNEEMTFWLDPELSDVETALTVYEEGRFSPDHAATVATFQGGNAVWFARELEGSDGGPWHVSVAPLNPKILNIYLIREGGEAEQLMAFDFFAGAPASDFYYHRWRSDAFDLAPGEEALLLVQLGGFYPAQPEIEVADDFGFIIGELRYAVAENLFIFGLLMLGLLSALAFLVLRDAPAAFVAVSFTLMVFQAQTYPRRSGVHLLFGDDLAPLTYSPFFIVTGLAIAWHAIVAPMLFRDRLGWQWAAILSAAGAAFVGYLAYAATQIQEVWVFNLFYYAFLACVIPLGFVISRWWNRSRPVMITIAGLYLGTILWSVLVNRMGWDGGLVFVQDKARFLLGGLTLALLGMLILLAFDVLRDRRELQRREREAKRVLERQAQTDRRLLEAERRYSRARDLARHHRDRLASASHDIRQPLVGLRAALEQESDRLDPDSKQRMREALSYLDGLSAQYVELEDTQGEEDNALGIGLLFDTISRMFEAEAKEAGIALKIVPSSVDMDVPPLDLMRMLCNAVANAIRHAGASRVLVGYRRGEKRLAVIDDGDGIAAADKEALLAARAKSPSSDGHGLGLSIISELAAKHGLDFALESTPGKGTAVCLSQR